MTSFTDVFTGSPISPGEVSYRAFSIATDTTLTANDRSSSTDSAARVMDVTATNGLLTLRLPAANLLATGFAYIITNAGSNTFFVAGNGGAVLTAISAGQQWQFYVTNNSSAAGAWRAVQFGASTSAASAGALAGAGLKAQGALLAVKQEVQTFNSTTTAGSADRGKVLTWTGGAGTLNLPAASTVGADWVVGVKNAGSGNLLISPASGTIDGGSSVQIAPTESTYIVTDGADYYTVGAGRASSFSFTYQTINAAGSGSYTLSVVEQNKTAYKFTGTLTGNRNIIVPNTVQQYWIDNATSGAYTLTVKTSAGTGVTVTQGQRAILYCDGTNVVDADTSGLATPIAIADGGTGATTASAARTNLGATSVGGGLFTAASAAAARSTIGSSVVGDALFTAADAAAARTTLGASSIGSTIFGAADAAAVRMAIGASTIGSTILTAADAGAVRTAITVPATSLTLTAGTGLTGGGDLSANRTFSLATIATGNLFGNVSGSAAAPSAITPTQALDIVGSTRGQILYRGASAWLPLAAGTAGAALVTGGAGADPSWGNIPGPRPANAAGVGQWYAFPGTADAAAVLPSGGTWAWFAVIVNSSSGAVSSVSGAGISAGGTTVAGAAAGFYYIGFAWRIS